LKRFTQAVLLGAAVAVLGCLVALSPLGLAMERNLGLPVLFDVRGPLLGPQNVAVIGINAETGTDLELPALPRDWPRSIHAELIERLVERNAAVIVFDIHFSREKDAQDDGVLVAAVRDSGRVVLFERLTGKTQPLTDVSGNKVGEVWS
jgi:adenylate cyclase